MRKKNGMTMIEIMIAIVLISIVMVFVFNILIDLRKEETVSGLKSADQINRSIIIRTIQNDFLNKGIKEISSCQTASNTYYACIKVIHEDNDINYIKVDKNYFYYGPEDSIEKWHLNSTSYDSEFAYCYLEEGGYYYLQFLFPIIQTENIKKSKMIFDIELLYMGKIIDNSGIPKDGGVLGARKVCSTLT